MQRHVYALVIVRQALLIPILKNEMLKRSLKSNLCITSQDSRSYGREEEEQGKEDEYTRLHKKSDEPQENI